MKRSYNHVKAQKEGVARDYGTCQLCGSKIDPQGHHVFDFAVGGAANANNIVTLCSKCHRKVHNNKIDIKLY